MPPGSFPVDDEGRKIGKVSLEDLQKRMQQTEGNASSIERQLNDVRNHLKTLREHVTFDGNTVQSLDMDTISIQNGVGMKHQEKQQEVASNNRDDSPALRLVVDGAESEIARVKHKVDQVQIELQLSLMSFTTLQLQVKAKHQAQLPRHQQLQVDHLQEQLDKKSRQLEQLSGSYESLRNCFIGKEAEFQERQLVSGTLKALGDHLNTDSANQEVSKIDGLSVEVKDWCATTEIKADDHCEELKQLRSELAGIATSFLQTFEPNRISRVTSRQASPLPASPPPPSSPPSRPPVLSKKDMSSDKTFAQMSSRIDELVQELNSHSNTKPETQDKVSRNLWFSSRRQQAPVPSEREPQPESTPTSPDAGNMNLGSGKRKLYDALQNKGAAKPDEEARAQPDVDEVRDKNLQKKNLLSSQREQFHRVRQREMLCAAMDQRLIKVRLLLEQAQRGWGYASSDHVSLKSKQQIEQAYQELTHVQADIETIKTISSEQQQELLEAMSLPAPVAAALSEPGSLGPVVESADMQRLKSEFLRQVELNTKLKQQVELNTKLKQQVARLSMQAERAEGVMAAERMEVEKLRQQVQGITDKLKEEARSLSESHFEALRVRDLTIQRLGEQIRNDEQKRDEALYRIEELSLENERLQAKVGGQGLDILKLRKDNVCLVVEKLAFEGSARSLQEKMTSFMTKLSQTTQNWKRFVVYCESS